MRNPIADTVGRRQVIRPTRQCHECDEEALGRCPECRQGLCQDHFPKHQHAPCAEKHMRQSQEQVCYVCGTQVYPEQWSISRTSHFIDQLKCKGCGRYICDELHTQRKADDVVIVREGMRGHRYQYTTRYCDLCAPISRINGIRGLTSALVAVGTVAAGIFFYLHH